MDERKPCSDLRRQSTGRNFVKKKQKEDHDFKFINFFLRYEFFEDTLGTNPGVNYRVPIHLSAGTGSKFDFQQFINCPLIGKCGSSVDLLYVVDYQFNNADYVFVKVL